MRDRKYEIWEVVLECIAAIAAIACLGLQIYAGYAYEAGMGALLHHMASLLILYAGMTALQIFPEALNGFGSEPLQGRVRVFAVRMIRNGKLFLTFGMLLPSVADALGARMNAAYSLLVMAATLGNIGYYMYRIFRHNSKKKT